MNKKLLMFGLPILAIGLVCAIGYYALFSVTFNVSPAVVVSGELEQPLGDILSGDTIIGTPITITNDATSLREVILSDDSPDEIETTYTSELTLSQKVVDFGNEPWVLTGDEVVVKYTLVGDIFTAEVTEGELTGYELIYYKDNSDRFNSPAQAIKLSEISGNLPYVNDKNTDEYDYCSTGEYETCHGAKIWYVPTTAILSDGSLDWSKASDFYFETKLVQFNSAGEIVIYGGDSLEVTPEYTPSPYTNGAYIITTTVA